MAVLLEEFAKGKGSEENNACGNIVLTVLGELETSNLGVNKRKRIEVLNTKHSKSMRP